MSDDRDPSYQSARVDICESAGRLVSVRYGFSHVLPADVSAVVLCFESGEWLLTVAPDDDTIRIQEAAASHDPDLTFRDPPAASPWAPALGKTAVWAWVLENQQGYADGVQFSFGDTAECAWIQMIAEASAWKIHGWNR